MKKGENVKIAFRLDDVCPQMDWIKFTKAIEIFHSHNIKPLLGIVPDCKDTKLWIQEPNPRFFQLMRELKMEGFLIAQHGFEHVYTSNDSGLLFVNKRSEFAGLPYHIQVEKIRKGKQILEQEGLGSNIFMAPAHSYDKNTLIALGECGFKYVTDGYTCEPYQFMGLKFIPCRHNLRIRRRVSGVVTSCLHINSMVEEHFEQLDKLLEKYKSSCVDYSTLLTAKNNNLFWNLKEKQYILKSKIINFIGKQIQLVGKAKST